MITDYDIAKINKLIDTVGSPIILKVRIRQILKTLRNDFEFIHASNYHIVMRVYDRKTTSGYVDYEFCNKVKSREYKIKKLLEKIPK